MNEYYKSLFVACHKDMFMALYVSTRFLHYKDMFMALPELKSAKVSSCSLSRDLSSTATTQTGAGHVSDRCTV